MRSDRGNTFEEGCAHVSGSEVAPSSHTPAMKQKSSVSVSRRKNRKVQQTATLVKCVACCTERQRRAVQGSRRQLGFGLYTQ
eukprot:3017276-Amphidinium_carterae.1